MYAVVTYMDGKQANVGQPKQWADVWTEYEKEAAFINEKNHKGEYARPRIRVAIRNLN